MSAEQSTQSERRAGTQALIGNTEIITATAVGYVLFGDFTAPLTRAGIAVIVPSGIYVAIRVGAAGRRVKE